MKKALLLLLIFFSSKLYSQIKICLRDTYYAQVGYITKTNYEIGIEHSLYSEHMRLQKIRLLVGYHYLKNNTSLSAVPYFSTLWNGYYQDCGAYLTGNVCLLKHLYASAIVNPHYDTGIKYMTNYSLGLRVGSYYGLSIVGEYTTIPQYRVSEKLINIGVEVKIGTLWVRPELSLPMSGDRKTGRVICSFGYSIGD